MFSLIRFDKFTIAAAFILLMVPWLVFWPGVSGPFLFDDFLNLRTMGSFDGITNLDSLRAFVFSGISSELGRPLAMLSFVADARDWPADPHPFKQTNILIHTINGLLLFAVTSRLFRLLGLAHGSSRVGAFLAAMIWVLHPMQIATVLYVVQRMTELSALFILFGTWGYLVFRQRMVYRPQSSLVFMTLIVSSCTGLAILSKENGALLPLLLLVIEFTVLQSWARTKQWWLWGGVMLIGPSLALLAYMLFKVSDPALAFSQRDFSLYERLLTQPRVLLDYLQQFLLPLSVPELLHDDIPISSSLFDSFKTPLAILLVLVLTAAALIWRRSQPILSFAIMWFFAAHLLESTVLPLEIYFDHRNYLPYAGLAIALAYYLLKLNRGVVAVGSGVMVLVMSVTTWQYSNVWGNQEQLLETWYEQSPNSIRTRNEYANYQLGMEKINVAYELLFATHEKFPHHLGTHILMVGVGCITEKLTPSQYSKLLNNTKAQLIDTETYLGYSNLYGYVLEGSCKMLNPQAINIIGNALLNNKTIGNNQVKRNEVRNSVFLILSDLYLKQGNIASAIKALDEVYAAKPQTGIPLRQAYFAINTRQWGQAEHYLALAEQSNSQRNPLMASRQPDIQALQSMLRKKQREGTELH